MIFRLVLSTLPLLACFTASAASFDCAKATLPQEKLVCGDKELSRLDDQMGVAYAQHQSNSPNPTDGKKEQLPVE